ncbi:hypothetical protein OG709_02515 [Streptomyces sp. NBC_01267]|uniref:hypothetical protein n=1 Tax=unclassified Streptomyces TaxID=2593676 RepID=UPI002E2FCB0C|nr:hypothetical protein [Streptomyces sp. NBC_01267]WSV58017.1 hypothetical protein OG282_32385 [Streptomyces sp. NBC_01014]
MTRPAPGDAVADGGPLRRRQTAHDPPGRFARHDIARVDGVPPARGERQTRQHHRDTRRGPVQIAAGHQGQQDTPAVPVTGATLARSLEVQPSSSQLQTVCDASAELMRGVNGGTDTTPVGDPGTCGGWGP